MRVEFSPEAMDDLEEIARYIARDDPEAALKWVDRLVDRAEKAGLAPRGGRIAVRVIYGSGDEMRDAVDG